MNFFKTDEVAKKLETTAMEYMSPILEPSGVSRTIENNRGVKVPEEIRERIKIMGMGLQPQYQLENATGMSDQMQREFNEAMDTLRNPEKRAAYDRLLRPGLGLYPLRGRKRRCVRLCSTHATIWKSLLCEYFFV